MQDHARGYAVLALMLSIIHREVAGKENGNTMRRLAGFVVLVTGIISIFTTIARAEYWPCWRGPRGDGTCLEQNVPTNWDVADAVWKTDVPGPGHASPIVWGDRVFTVTALPENAGARAAVLRSRHGKDPLAADRRAGAAGEDQQREQLCLRHAGHRRQAGLRHLSRRRRDRRGRARPGRAESSSGWSGRERTPASGDSATSPCCTRTRSSSTATARAIPF